MPDTRRDNTVCVPFSDTELEPIDQAAIREGHIHASGKPVRAVMIRRLVIEALKARENN